MVEHLVSPADFLARFSEPAVIAFVAIASAILVVLERIGGRP